MDEKIQRLILKENDILLVKVPQSWFSNRGVIIKTFYKNMKKKLSPRKNKILILPEDVNISVIGENEIKEHISDVDIWNLFDENNEDD